MSLSLSPSAAITDGAVLIRRLVEPSRRKEYEVSFIPHCSAAFDGPREMLQQICEQQGVHFIDCTWPLNRVIDEINRSRHLIAEALHGAIAADSLRVPWCPVIRRGVLAFKWKDWMQSLELRYRPTFLAYRPRWFAAERAQRRSRRIVFPVIRPVSRSLLAAELGYLKKHGRWVLSEQRVLDDRLRRVEDKLFAISEFVSVPRA